MFAFDNYLLLEFPSRRKLATSAEFHESKIQRNEQTKKRLVFVFSSFEGAKQGHPPSRDDKSVSFLNTPSPTVTASFRRYAPPVPVFSDSQMYSLFGYFRFLVKVDTAGICTAHVVRALQPWARASTLKAHKSTKFSLDLRAAVRRMD